MKETLPDGTTIWNISPRVDTGIHVEKRLKTNGELSYHYSLYAGGMPFGVYKVVKATSSSTAVISRNYYHTDHLGSIIAITNDAGTVVERRSFDAWGKRRNQNGTPLSNAFVTSDVRHAFTGHEDLGEVGLIHMNGRLYDPTLGRFMSADPTIQYADDMQNYNRYSYINNNPLSATDPSGHGFFKSIFKGVKKLFKNKVFRIVASIAIAVFAPEFIGSTNFLYGSLYSASNVIAGAASGLVASGGSLRGALQGAVMAGVMGAVGDNFTGAIENTLAHAAVGCGSAVADGGSCGSGALSGGFSAAASPFALEFGRLGGAIASAVIGGTASVLGGGKFQNGAMTGAFGYLFNFCAHNGCFDRPFTLADAKDSWQNGGGVGVGEVGANEVDLSGASIINRGNNNYQINLSLTNESGRIYGTITGVLNTDGSMSFKDDFYNYDYKSTSGQSGSEAFRIFGRNIATFVGRNLYIGDGVPYKIYFSGSKSLSIDTLKRLQSCKVNKSC